MTVIDTINYWLTTTFLFLLVGTAAFGLLALAMILGAKHNTSRRGRMIALRERMRFAPTSKWYLRTLSDKAQYVPVGAAVVVALLTVVVGGVAGLVFGCVALVLFAVLRYWLAL
jgi:cobalamin synthase